jgi:hypothetical protein
VALFVKADCVQGVWYNEVYESEKNYNDRQDVIELSDSENTPEGQRSGSNKYRTP